MSMKNWWRDTDRGKPKYWEKPVSVPPCQPQITRGIVWVRTRVSAVRGWWLAICAMAVPM